MYICGILLDLKQLSLRCVISCFFKSVPLWTPDTERMCSLHFHVPFKWKIAVLKLLSGFPLKGTSCFGLSQIFHNFTFVSNFTFVPQTSMTRVELFNSRHSRSIRSIVAVKTSLCSFPKSYITFYIF